MMDSGRTFYKGKDRGGKKKKRKGEGIGTLRSIAARGKVVGGVNLAT